ncbi:MAG: hypothetical protein M3P50_03010 [Actinomycetota bacterium]|nr:hypothetical protein [Actinomycetota bacterium]
MTDARRVLALVLVGASAVWAALGHHSPAPEPAGPLTEDVRAAGLRFDPSVAPLDRQAVTDAIAAARPEARRLVEVVDGLVIIGVADTGAGAVGVTQQTAVGYTVTLDLADVSGANGARGISRLVLHELGHVIDSALVPDDVVATLDAGIPKGWECDGGHSGACAAVPERFAESFAKWATGDIGVDLHIGYRVPPPGPTLDAWGEPLARLGA